MKRILAKRKNRNARQARIRAKISGTSDKPRIHVFKSNQHLYVQVIDDANGKTLISATDAAKGKKAKAKTAKSESAKTVGKTVGEKMKSMGMNAAVFDRGGFKYHGRIKAVADAIREEGIKF